MIRCARSTIPADIAAGHWSKITAARCVASFVATTVWTYDLTGQLINLRDNRDFVDLDKDQHALVDVRCERLGNWVFVNEDPNAEPLLDHLGVIPEQLAQFDLDTTRHVDTRSYDVACKR